MYLNFSFLLATMTTNGSFMPFPSSHINDDRVTVTMELLNPGFNF